MKEKWLTESWQKPPAEVRAFREWRASSLNAPGETLDGKSVAAQWGELEPPVRAIGELTGLIVSRLKLLRDFDVATAARN